MNVRNGLKGSVVFSGCFLSKWKISVKVILVSEVVSSKEGSVIYFNYVFNVVNNLKFL